MSETEGLKLPRFLNPPVVEVAMSVAFEQLTAMRAVHFGQLWLERFQNIFPLTEEQPPLEPATEEFGPVDPPPFRVRFDDGAPAQRLWFLKDDLSELLQVQSNWFGRNWRRMDKSADYPSFKNLEPAFFEDLRRFEDFVEEHKLGQLVPHQCELTYINEIHASHDILQSVLKVADWPVIPEELKEEIEPEACRLNQQYLLGPIGSPSGRLYVTANPAFRRTDRAPIYVVQLTARGLPGGSPGVLGVKEFFGLAHRAIVLMFTALTTNARHQEWRRE